MDFHARYDLRRVINACGKMTKLSGAVVVPEIADTVRESLDRFEWSPREGTLRGRA